MGKVTIKDIAHALGISYTTVSRALTNQPGVNSQTKEKILKEAKQQGYHPNILARALVLQKTNAIGLLVPDITNPFQAAVTRGVEKFAQDYDYTLILGDNNHRLELERKFINRLVSYHVDGLIVQPLSSESCKIILKSRIPTVLLNSTIREGLSAVSIDNIQGGFLATEHLIVSGFKNIALVGAYITTHSYFERHKGYCKALKENGLPYNEGMVFSDVDKKYEGTNVVEKALKSLQGRNRPDAFVAANDMTALEILRKWKLYHPDKNGQIGIIGFDDIPIASFPEIELSTITQPTSMLARKAVDLLHNEISENGKAEIQQVILKPEIIVRRTLRK